MVLAGGVLKKLEWGTGSGVEEMRTGRGCLESGGRVSAGRWEKVWLERGQRSRKEPEAAEPWLCGIYSKDDGWPLEDFSQGTK